MDIEFIVSSKKHLLFSASEAYALVPPICPNQARSNFETLVSNVPTLPEVRPVAPAC